MAPITWGPRICAPPPPVPTAPGGFEDLRKGKEKLALTLQNNPAWVGWGGGTPQRSKCCGGLIPVQWLLRNLSLGGNRGSLSTWPEKEMSVFFSDLPPQAPGQECTAQHLLSF